MKPSLALLTGGMCLVLAVGALATGNKRAETRLSLHLGPDVGLFRGAVHSDASACIQHRKVRVRRAASDEVVGSDRTNDQGRYAVHTDEQSGEWYARIKPDVTGGIFCKGDRSPTRAAG